MVHAQIDGELTTKYPVFPSCEPVNMEMLPSCFNNAIREILHENFQTPEIAKTENYSGEVRVLFEVDENGTFHVLYTDSVYEEVKDEVKRVFKMIPKIKPASYNGKPTHAQFTISFMIPLGALKLESTNSVERFDLESNNTMEYDNLESLPYENDVYKSALNIPLSHHNYSLFDAYLNQVGTNTHTAQKPFCIAM